MQTFTMLACRPRRRLQRPEIIQQILLILRRELIEQADHLIGLGALTCVIVYRSQEPAICRICASVVQEEYALPHSPQRSGAKLVARSRALRNIVCQT